MNILQKEINFDRFVRGLVFLTVLAALVWVVGLLSDVLLPFFIAWVLAYQHDASCNDAPKQCQRGEHAQPAKAQSARGLQKRSHGVEQVSQYPCNEEWEQHVAQQPDNPH